MKYLILLTSFICFTVVTTAQTFSGRVIDKDTGEPIIYATIETGVNEGMITNDEGEFSFQLDDIKHPLDSIYVSYMGYKTRGILFATQENLEILLLPNPIELDEVYVMSKKLTTKEIINNVKENLDKNYNASLSRKKIFFRQSEIMKVQKMDFGFKKSTIEELNKKLLDSISKLIPNKTIFYKEVVADFYGDNKTHKLDINKAAELYDKNNDISAEGIGEKLEKIFNENVKKDSYIKIKSGIFSTKVQVDSILQENEDAKEALAKQKAGNSNYFHEQVSNKITDLYEQLFFQEDTKIDILKKSSRYEFTLDGYTVFDEMAVYIIKFIPKGSKDFKGTMYVNTEDFGIVRLDFENVKPISKFSLLGLTYRNNVYKGKMLFKKDVNGIYSPKYLELMDGTYFGLDRSLKVIEKNKNVKGKRKQNELSMALDIRMNQIIKYEMVVFESETISKNSYDNLIIDETIKATYLSEYDPAFWQDYTIMAPNEAIESFKVVE